jgi:3-deoxy-D-manno-octulosonic acid kinase
VIQKDPHESEAAEVAAATIAVFAGRVVLFDPALLPDPSPRVFSLGYWRSRAAVTGTAPGRGSVWFVNSGSGEWAVRHYRRGGMVGRLIEDHYLWAGQARVRAIAEWRLLADLHAAGMPVPRPVAAAYVREGLFYTCDLITQRLADTRTLATLLGQGESKESLWRDVGRVTRRFHAFGIDHADLNAHNILIDSEERVYLIDFDQARQRQPGHWQERNLARLKRSLLKVCPEPAQGRLTRGWQAIEAGYATEQDQE